MAWGAAGGVGGNPNQTIVNAFFQGGAAASAAA